MNAKVTIVVEQDEHTYTMYLPEVVSLEPEPIIQEETYPSCEVAKVVGFKITIGAAYHEASNCTLYEWIDAHTPDEMRGIVEALNP